MKYEVTTFRSDVEFIEENEEDIDEEMLRCAMERQVRVSLGLDAEVVHVSPFEVTIREVVRCDYCEEIDATVAEQRSAVNDGRVLEHVCQKCRSQYPELEDDNGKRTVAQLG